MYQNKKILAFIPARSGSKRVPHKNGVLLNGKMLFEYSIDVAMKSKYIDQVLFSTDCEEWLEHAHHLGCIPNTIRPAELSSDYARIVDVMLYEINQNALSDMDAVVLLQPTSPYRTVELLDSAIEEYFKTETSLITVVEAKEQPIFMRKIHQGKLEKIVNSTSDVRSQDFEKIYKIVGNIYINNLKDIKPTTVLNENQVAYVMNPEFDVDIDTWEDFKRIEEMMRKKP